MSVSEATPAAVWRSEDPLGPLVVERGQGGSLVLRLGREWGINASLPTTAPIEDAIAKGPAVARLTVDASAVGAWGSALPVFLRAVEGIADRYGIPLDMRGLPDGVRKLLDLASAVPPPRGAAPSAAAPSVLSRVGKRALGVRDEVRGYLTFLGETILAFVAWLRGRARYRPTELRLIIQEAGPKALPIVSLISFLVGLILAFVGAVQLARFGAQIYIADLVGLAMAREMGAIMTGIIMAGRTGAAFAAQLGTMQVSQEIDALKTLGIAPAEFLVLPRVLALVLMMPVLTLYAILVGIAGGLVVSVGLFDLTLVQYWEETVATLTLNQFGIGLMKSIVFAVLVAVAGCREGMRAAGSAAAVGDAATAAVVTGIVSIVVADGLFAVVLNAVGL
jgi:phospholipid/cholesterol/gamma-HCH transport system permease protein